MKVMIIVTVILTMNPGLVPYILYIRDGEGRWLFYSISFPFIQLKSLIIILVHESSDKTCCNASTYLNSPKLCFTPVSEDEVIDVDGSDSSSLTSPSNGVCLRASKTVEGALGSCRTQADCLDMSMISHVMSSPSPSQTHSQQSPSMPSQSHRTSVHCIRPHMFDYVSAFISLQMHGGHVVAASAHPSAVMGGVTLSDYLFRWRLPDNDFLRGCVVCT